MVRADTALTLLPLYVPALSAASRQADARWFPLTDPAKGEPSGIVRCEQISEGMHGNKLRRDCLLMLIMS